MRKATAGYARERWFDDLASRILQLAGEHAPVFRRYQPIAGRDLGAAALVVWVCVRTRHGRSTATTVEHLARYGVLASAPDVVTAVRTVRLKWADRGVPAPDWWDEVAMLHSLLTYLAPRLAAGLGPEAAASHLSEVFQYSPKAIRELVAGPVSPDPVPTLRFGRGKAAGVLAAIATNPAVTSVVDELCASAAVASPERVLPGFWGRAGDSPRGLAGLQKLARTVYTWRSLAETTAGLAELTEDALPEEWTVAAVRDAATFAADRWAATVASLRALTWYEQSLVRERSQIELRRGRWLDAHLRCVYIPLLMPDSVPDVEKAGDEPAVPGWVQAEVFGLGARVMRDLTGPLPLWWAVLEGSDPRTDLDNGDRGGRVGMGLDRDGPSVTLQVPVGGLGPDPPMMPFHYSLDDLSSAVELLVTVLAGARLDYYRLSTDGLALRHESTACIVFPPGVLDALLADVDAAFGIAEERSPGIDPMWLMRPDADVSALMFLSSDNAKSEALLAELEPGDSPSEVLADVAAARAELATARVAAVAAAVDGAPEIDAAAQVAAAADRYHRARQAVARRGQGNPADLLAGTVTPHRAFVQYGEFEDYPGALVATDSGDGVKATFVDLSSTNITMMREIHDLWTDLAGGDVATAAASLDTMLEWAGRHLVEPVVDAVGGTDIRELVLCPSRATEHIPLHAAPVGDGVLSDGYSVSYAPSARVLRALGETTSPATSALKVDLIVAATGEHAPADLKLPVLLGPDLEVAALRRLRPKATPMTGRDATPAAVLAALANSEVAHLASHGEAATDAYASGLWLAGRRRSEALLSAAAVLAAPPLTTTRLLVLSACETARHPVGGTGVQAWRGLDSAFLARGVRSVISTLWSVGDLPALWYGVELHTALLSGATVGAAHRTAVDALRLVEPTPAVADVLDPLVPGWLKTLGDVTSIPYLWSAFRLSGIAW